MTSTESSVTATIYKKRIRLNGSNTVWFWSPECKYEVIINNVKSMKIPTEFGKGSWKLIEDEKNESKVNIYWIDVSTIHERFRKIQPWQIINHFPGMPNIARKNRMGQNLNKMLKLFPKEYAFYPKTWVLPGEIADFRQQFDNSGNSIGNKIYIIKPDTGCQGRGIFLTKTFDNIPQNENVVAQVYMKKPLLIDGFKFDLRLYCLVTSVKPLRMYLFQDGLVRMCTEEYVKPNKQNINNVCMHLTNYAVNKRNANFQQPSAKSSEENQDEGSKRSLKWFMSYIQQEKGDAKAEWLWRRMGILCVRSVLAIIPTLSREYDQHFKSFSNIPVNPNEIESPNENKAPKRAKSANQHQHDIKTGSDDTNDHDSTSEEDDSESSKDIPFSYPKIRGSRCFEVLGFDVMIDSNLKPWIIEVNHLPSFGTDSPLDYDIKDRLMKQVLPSIAVLPDDEQTYAIHQKAEASKRLTARQVIKEQHTQNNQQINKKITTAKPIKPIKKTFTKVDRLKARKLKLKNELIPSHLMMEPMDSGICLPERFEEIKSILIEIYSQHSPDKVNKIDRLLAKYQSREEEFLKYVYNKYGITPPWATMRERYQLQQQELLAIETELMMIANNVNNSNSNSTNNVSNSNNEVDTKPKEESEIINNSENESKPVTSREGSADHNRNSARSLSPPSNRSLVTNQKPTSLWKMSQDEEVNYRNEVLLQHYPKEDDEWLQRESKILSQFTRIFPPESSAISKNDKNDDESIDMKEDDDNDDDGVVTVIPKEEENKSNNNNTVASYEDILFQVFLHDKRQTQRLTCPLPSRIRPTTEMDSQSLPPLDTSNRNSMTNNAKGVVGWKQPPPNNDKKEIVKVPTQSQVEAATRLSQGLSVSETQKRNRNQSNYQPRFIPTAFVMDPRVYIGPQINNISLNIPPPQQQTIINNVPSNSLSQTGRNVLLLQNQQTYYNYNPSNSIAIDMQLINNKPPNVLKQQIYKFEQKNDLSNLNEIIQNQSTYNTNGTVNSTRNNSIFNNGTNVIGGSAKLNDKKDSIQYVRRSNSNSKVDETMKDELLRQLFPGWF